MKEKACIIIIVYYFVMLKMVAMTFILNLKGHRILRKEEYKDM